LIASTPASPRRLLDNSTTGVNEFLRVMQQHVPLTMASKMFLCVVNAASPPARTAEISNPPVDHFVKAHEPHQVQRPFESEGVLRRERQMFAKRANRSASTVLDLEAHAAPPPQVGAVPADFFLADFGFLCVDVEVAVARDAKSMRPFDYVAREKPSGASLMISLRNTVAQRPFPTRRQLHNPRQAARTGRITMSSRPPACRGIEAKQDYERLVCKQRKGMRLIDAKGVSTAEPGFRNNHGSICPRIHRALSPCETARLLGELRQQIFVPAAYWSSTSTLTSDRCDEVAPVA